VRQFLPPIQDVHHRQQQRIICQILDRFELRSPPSIVVSAALDRDRCPLVGHPSDRSTRESRRHPGIEW